ncbi:MAG: hypothetical protein ACU85U_10740 [Gammaproteobacteria bacterium]|jgi:hypothetical protein
MNSTPATLGRNGARTLALGGLGLAVAGFLLGEIYAIFISHVANGVIKAAWLDVVQATATANSEALEAAFARVLELSDKRGRFMSTHSHIGAYGLLALALAILHPGFRRSPGGLRMPALGLIAGAWLHCAGTFASHYLPGPATAVAMLGQLLVIGALLAFAVAWLRGDTAPLTDTLRPRLHARNSRWLLANGLALVIAGMGFGVWFALGLTRDLEPGMFDAIRAAVSAAAAGAADNAALAITRFKTLQSQIAITAAAHSHAIEFGFLLMLLAFLEPFVMLSQRWRRRWTNAVIIGAWLLPVCVFLATIHGLTAAAAADIAGGFTLAGLIGMFIGILRSTGAADSLEASS